MGRTPAQRLSRRPATPDSRLATDEILRSPGEERSLRMTMGGGFLPRRPGAPGQTQDDSVPRTSS
jgi:hypothetical protein